MDYKEKVIALLNSKELSKEQKEKLEDIFPELKESEDERIRKDIIILVKDWWDRVAKDNISTKERMIDWLEKQAQNPAWSEEDKNMLKWVIGYLDNRVLNTPISEERTACKNAIDWLLEKQGEQKPAWSEKDAKLWLHDDDIFLDAVKVIVGDSPRRSYGGVHKKEIVPWLLSLKERLKVVKDRVQSQPKQEWSEEDEEHIKSLLERLEGMYKKDATFIKTRFAVSEDEDWLKHLKDRVLQPKQEWSEEDNQYLCGLIGLIEQSKAELPITLKGKAADKCIDWLKSLKERYAWRPSEGQL